MAEQEFNEDSNYFDDSTNDPPDVKTKKVRPELPVQLKLEYPFEFGTTLYTEITFKNRLKYRDIQHLRGDGETQLGHYKPLIRGMTGLPSEAIEELDPVDFMRATKVVEPFLPSGLQADGTIPE